MCRCCFGDVEGESCGWPKGTVRGTIALVSIPMAFAIACACMVILIIKDQYEVALGINGGIWSVVGTIIGYYFGTKQGEAAAKLLSQNGHELIESRNREIDRNIQLSREMNARGFVPIVNPGMNPVFQRQNDDVVLDME